jgi:hypothetical protein
VNNLANELAAAGRGAEALAATEEVATLYADIATHSPDVTDQQP